MNEEVFFRTFKSLKLLEQFKIIFKLTFRQPKIFKKNEMIKKKERVFFKK